MTIRYLTICHFERPRVAEALAEEQVEKSWSN
jgi:hypothetical protein